MIVVDDVLLLGVVAGRAVPELEAELADGTLYTTASWYYRLSRAISSPAGTGALSRALSALPPTEQAAARSASQRLPRQVGLLHLRQLVPVMTNLVVGRSLNFLTAEALAAAVVLDAVVAVTTESEVLSTSAARLGLEVRTLL